MDLWPHQDKGITETLAGIERGWRRILLTSPTGGGKSRMICEIIDRLAAEGWYVVLYSNRVLLIEQLSKVLSAHGIDFGVRAAGYSEESRFEPVQISSLPTERARVLKAETWRIHGEGKKCLAVVDEAHLNDNPTARAIFALHEQVGHVRLGVTATPLGLGDSYDHLICAGTTSELRACGALVPCHHFGPDEPDCSKIKKVALGEDLSENEARKVMMVPGIFARVLEWFGKLNPERRPTILFAPGVRESIWFAEQFHAAGISAAHIDGEEVWINGELKRSDRGARQEILEGSRDGRINVLCNRFVLREGIDCPWLAHGIFATVFGSLQSYLQSGGRLLRAHPGLESVTLQDHGGNWWRHGSLNEDREWRLEYTAAMVAGLRESRFRQPGDKKPPEPALCPQCRKVIKGPRCPACKWELPPGTKRSRPVIQSDGTLKEMRGDIYKPRRISSAPNGPQLWAKMYWRSRTTKGSRTFRQAFALFAQENNWGWPDRRWPFMPRYEIDEFKLVKNVPLDRLVQPAGMASQGR